MSEPQPEPMRREAARKRTERDLARLERRKGGTGFWHAIAVIGGVGWPIVLLSTGGALVGRRLDMHFGSGVRYTLILLMMGTTIGCWSAWHAMKGRP